MDEIKNLGIKIKDNFLKIKNKKNFLVISLGILGIVLILISEILPEKKEDKIPVSAESCVFEKEIEAKLEEAVSQINGAGKTDITVTFDSSREFFYAKNSSENIADSESETESEFVILEGSEGEEPIILKTTEAKVRGVLVVCEGGDDPFVCEKILEAICALLDVPSNKVSVAKMA
jgi:stage III sporulation protein AG